MMEKERESMCTYMSICERCVRGKVYVCVRREGGRSKVRDIEQNEKWLKIAHPAQTNLVGIHIAQSVLYMTINDQLRKSQNLTAQVEGISEARLLTLLMKKYAHVWHI